MTRIYDLPAVADALALTPAEFSDRWPYLRRVGFPRHLPGLGLRWSKAQVDAWIDAGGVLAEPEPAPLSGLRLVVDNDHRALRQRYAGGRA